VKLPREKARAVLVKLLTALAQALCHTRMATESQRKHRSNHMPNKPTGLQQLLVEELQDLYDAEKQLTRALPKVAKATSDEELGEAIREHLEVTKGHVQRLEQAFESMGLKAKSKPCAGMKGIVEESSETIQEKKGEESELVLDVAIAGGARRVEHYEIAGYSVAIEMARELGHDDVAGLLEETLHEEEEADEKLAEISQRILTEAVASEQEPDEDDEESEEETEVEQRGAAKPKTRTAR
jgi:ferritin-like metal-binding protein YciE